MNFSDIGYATNGNKRSTLIELHDFKCRQMSNKENISTKRHREEENLLFQLEEPNRAIDNDYSIYSYIFSNIYDPNIFGSLERSEFLGGNLFPGLRAQLYYHSKI